MRAQAPDQSQAIRWATEPSARCRPKPTRGRREAALELPAPETARDIGTFSVAEHPRRADNPPGVASAPWPRLPFPRYGSLGHDLVSRTDAVSSTAVSSARWRACAAAVFPARVWAVGRRARRVRRR